MLCRKGSVVPLQNLRSNNDIAGLNGCYVLIHGYLFQRISSAPGLFWYQQFIFTQCFLLHYPSRLHREWHLNAGAANFDLTRGADCNYQRPGYPKHWIPWSTALRCRWISISEIILHTPLGLMIFSIYIITILQSFKNIEVSHPCFSSLLTALWLRFFLLMLARGYSSSGPPSQLIRFSKVE